MYKVLQVLGGYQVFWIENDTTQPRPVRVEPYKHRQSAHRKAKELNAAVKDVNDMIKKDGAIIL